MIKAQRTLAVLSSTQFVVLEFPNLFQIWDITTKKLSFEFELHKVSMKGPKLALVHVYNSTFCALVADTVVIIDAQLHSCVELAKANYEYIGVIDHYLYAVTEQNVVRLFNTTNNFSH